MPTSTLRRRVLITLDTCEVQRRGVPFPAVQLKTAYGRAVAGAGATPFFAAPTDDVSIIEDLLRMADAVVVSGGAFDIPPDRYGHSGSADKLGPLKPERTNFEWSLLEMALAAGRPILGVCGGMQLLNVVLGGSLVQDIGTDVPGSLEHEQACSPAQPDHEVVVAPGTHLHGVWGQDRLAVNSTHHQAVDALGRGLRVAARAPDGVIEAIEVAEDRRVLGVQWHPELLDDEAARALYAHLVACC